MTNQQLNEKQSAPGKVGADAADRKITNEQDDFTPSPAELQEQFYKSIALLPEEVRGEIMRAYQKTMRKALEKKQATTKKMLTKRMMINLLSRRVRGEKVEVDPTSFKEPYKRYWLALESAAPGREESALANATGENKHHYSQIMKANEDAPEFVPFSEMETGIKDASWYWDYRIPKGKLTVLGGEGGVSKSMLALKICQLQIDEKTFPDGTPIHNPGAPALYVDCEGFASGVKQRANAWGMSKDKFYLWTVDQEESGFINFSDPEFRDSLIERIDFIKPALVVIDSFGNAAEGGQDKVEDVRDLLNFLNQVAYEFDLGLVLIAHTRKPPAMFTGKGEINQDDIRGSGHVVNMARSVLGVWLVQTGPEPDPNGPRVMAVLKSNYGKKPKPIGYDVLSDANDNPKILFGDPAKPYKEPTKAQQCAEWMLEVLQDAGKPIPPKEFVEMAEKEGFKRGMLYEAHRVLEKNGQIVDTHGQKHPDNTWALSSQKLEQRV